jgi:adenosylcobinamide-GDP ribazoletransferase
MIGGDVGVRPQRGLLPGEGGTAVWRAAALSVSLLTTLPLPRFSAGPGALGATTAFFPLVGLALGLVLGGAGLLLDRALPPGPVAAILVLGGVVLTGGLHFDGLMDSADGVFGGRTRQRRLEIMRDSRVGSFGVLAGALALLLQYACLATLGGVARLVAMAAAMALARWAMVLAIALFPSARTDGLGASFHANAVGWAVSVATATALVVGGLAGPAGWIALAVVAVAVLAGGRFCAARLGGLTGDTYGALAVVAECLVYLVVVGVRP